MIIINDRHRIEIDEKCICRRFSNIFECLAFITYLSEQLGESVNPEHTIKVIEREFNIDIYECISWKSCMEH